MAQRDRETGYAELVMFFSKVEETFVIPGRGCVIVPGTPHDPNLRVHNRDPIQLRIAG